MVPQITARLFHFPLCETLAHCYSVSGATRGPVVQVPNLKGGGWCILQCHFDFKSPVNLPPGVFVGQLRKYSHVLLRAVVSWWQWLIIYSSSVIDECIWYLIYQGNNHYFKVHDPSSEKTQNLLTMPDALKMRRSLAGKERAVLKKVLTENTMLPAPFCPSSCSECIQ